MANSVLEEASSHIEYMKWFIEEVKHNTAPSTEKEEAKIYQVLEWHLKIAKQHYKNLLHCFDLSDKLKNNR